MLSIYNYEPEFVERKVQFLQDIKKIGHEKQKYETIFTYKIWEYSVFSVGEVRTYKIHKSSDDTQDFMTVDCKTHIISGKRGLANRIIRNQFRKAHNIHNNPESDSIIKSWNSKNRRKSKLNCWGFFSKKFL
tara:strand:+ start:2013 stop:2408 length:396 start_codon:yes stop_codon:yes gene_type:complete